MIPNYLDDSEEARADIKITFSSFVYTKSDGIYSQYDASSEKFIADGFFGQVYKIKSIDGLEEKALKKIQIDTISHTRRPFIKLQIQNHKMLDHPNIVKLYEVFSDAKYIYLVLQLLNGKDLFEWARGKEYKESEFAPIFYQTLLALAYAHEKQVIHRDLKPDNIMVEFDDRGRFTSQLIDWGLSSQNCKDLYKFRPTFEYTAPEALQDTWLEISDMWSFGVTMYNVITNSFLFRCKNDNELKDLIMGEKKLYFEEDPNLKGKSPQLLDLFQKLLERDYKKRLSARDALSHPWFTINNQSQNLQNNSQQISHNENLLRFRNKKSCNELQRIVISFLAHNSNQLERNQMSRSFVELDQNKDGKLSLEEIKNGFTEFQSEISSQELNEIQEIFTELDVDHSGFIDYNQFISACLNLDDILNEKNLQEAFIQLDLNRNGFIERKQIEKILDLKEDSFNIQQWNEIIESINCEDDQGISFENFQKLMNSLLIKKL